MNPEDLAQIHNCAALYGHVIDHHEWERLDEVYADDGVYDGTATGSTRHQGLDAVRTYLSTTPQPLVHHVTNIHVTFADDGQRATGRSKWFVVRPNMSVASGYYQDVWTKKAGQWRLQERASFRLTPTPPPDA